MVGRGATPPARTNRCPQRGAGRARPHRVPRRSKPRGAGGGRPTRSARFLRESWSPASAPRSWRPWRGRLAHPRGGRRCARPRPHVHHHRVPHQETRAPTPALRPALHIRPFGAAPRFRVAPGRPAPAQVPSPPLQPLVLHGRIRMPPSVGTGGIGCAVSRERGSAGSARRRRHPGKTDHGGGIANDRGERPATTVGARAGRPSARREAVTPMEKEPGKLQPGPR